MVVETAVLVTVAVSLASGLLKEASKKVAAVVSESSAVTDLRSTLSEGLRPQLCRLERDISKLDAVLRCAERMNPMESDRNDLLLLWLRSVKEAICFADNVLDDIAYEKIRRQLQKKRSRLRRVVLFKLFSNSVVSLTFRVQITRKVKKFRSMTDEIYKEATEIGLKPVKFVANAPSYLPPTAMSINLRAIRENPDPIVIGRQLDEDQVVDKLCNSDLPDLPVVAITGRSGVGKTALARKVNANNTVKEHFDKRIWIFASENLNLKRVLSEMLQSVTGVNHNLDNEGAMEQELQKYLKEKRYLLVLDDVWYMEEQLWESMRTSLKRVTESAGSRVLVTTQYPYVALVMTDSLIYHLDVLSYNDAWELFRGKAFQNKTEQQATDLKPVGERILRKSGGIPLAIKALGSLLGSMNERSQWESIEKSEVWNFPVNEDNKIMSCLLLSFNHLRGASLRQCFAHCSVMIVKGHFVFYEDLIHAWIAQGFIQQSEEHDNESMETIGQKYIRTLEAYGLLEIVVDRDGFTLLWMHDLTHDLAVFISKGTCLFVRDMSLLHNPSEAEHLVIIGGTNLNSHFSFSQGDTLSALRTLVCTTTTISMNFVAQARFLRYLRLDYCGLKEVPSSIGRLKHLRYLCLRGNTFECLPKSIGKLLHLQTLDLRECSSLMEITQQVTKLINLRHLYTSWPVIIPKGFRQLTRLQTLPRLCLKEKEGWKIKELGRLELLSGKVDLCGLEQISCRADAIEASLETKARITDLGLFWFSERQGGEICSTDEQIMDGLKPHFNLKYILVKNFGGKSFATWLSDQHYFHNLKKIILLKCNRCEQLPTLGQHGCLEEIIIQEMASLEVIGIDFFHRDEETVAATTNSSHNEMSKRTLFPQLKVLLLSDLPKLKNWVEPLGSVYVAFPHLERLEIINCPELVSTPACFQSLKAVVMKGVNSGHPLLMVLNSSSNITHLKIEHVQELTSLSHAMLRCTSLQVVNIANCECLTELPPSLRHLNSLAILTVRECNKLTSFPDIEGLLSLHTLAIEGCRKLTSIPSGLESCVSIETLSLIVVDTLNLIPDLGNLRRLQSLVVTTFSGQMSVPEWLSNLSRLRRLHIGPFNKELDELSGLNYLPQSVWNLSLTGWGKLKALPTELQFCNQLVSLKLGRFRIEALPEWISNLPSLQFLILIQCKKLKYLPSLDAMHRMTQLTTVEIYECPLLEERCNQYGGEEWHKICHLFSIKINGIDINRRF